MVGISHGGNLLGNHDDDDDVDENVDDLLLKVLSDRSTALFARLTLHCKALQCCVVPDQSF